MKFFFVVLLAIAPFTDLNDVATVNKHKRAANQAYLNGDYEIAAEHYRFLVDSMEIREESIMLNLANALYELQDSSSAKTYYQSLVNESTNKLSKSVAHQQLGLIDYGSKNYKEALGQFKNALKNNPKNEEARYNYELLKKLIEEQEEEQKQQDQNQENKEEQNEEQQDQQNKDQQDQEQQNKEQQEQEKQDQQNQEQQEQEQQENQENQENQEQQNQEQQEQQEEGEEQKPEEGEESEEQPEEIDPTTAEKLEEMNISEEKAKMILEALKNNEVQYIQQNKRKAKQRKKDGKPDW